MNHKSIIAGIVIAAGSSFAFAESYEAHNPHFVSTSSRAAVQEAVVNDKGIDPWSKTYDPLAQFQSGKTRSQVTADYIASRDLVDAFTGEDSGSGFLAGRPAAAGETRIAVSN